MIGKKTIVLVITNFDSFNNFLASFAIKLIRSGLRVVLITSPIHVMKLRDKFDYDKEGLIIEYVMFPRGFNIVKHLRASLEIKKIIKKYKPAIINLHFTTAMFTTFATGRIKDAYTIGMFHGLGYPLIDGFLNKAVFTLVEKYCFTCLDEIFVLNNFDYKLLKPKYTTKVFKLTEAGLGCDLRVFDSSIFDRETLRKTLGISQRSFVILFTGRYVHFKGYHLVIQAVRYILENTPDLDITLITLGGIDKLHPTGLSEDELQWASVNPSIKNIGFTDEVSKYLAVSDLFLFPSKREGLPVCLIEASAMGVPSLTFDVRGCNDIIDGSVGYLLDQSSSSEVISKKLCSIIENPSELEPKRSELLKRRSSYSSDKFEEAFEKHIFEAINDKGHMHDLEAG